MKAVRCYFHALISDRLFLRVCMFLWGLLLAALGAFAVYALSEEISGSSDGLVVAVMLFITAIIGSGLALVFAALFASDANAEKIANLMQDGGEWLGIVMAVVVVIFAVPLTALIRALR